MHPTFRAPSVLEAGVPADLYEHLDEYRTYPGYTERQRLFARLRAQFADDEILDLTLCLAVYLGLGRTLEVLQVDEACEVDL